MPVFTVMSSGVLLFFLAIQQVENNVLAPRIAGHALGLHPLGAMFALLAGFQLAGLFAVPVAGVVWVLLGAPYRNVIVETPPQRPFFPLSFPPTRTRVSAGRPTATLSQTDANA
jgi:predicted PurR-regulated permease PerM